MKGYSFLVATIMASCWCTIDIFAQVNAVPTANGLLLKPETVLLPTTQVTPQTITSDNFSESNYCISQELDTTEFKQLPWYGNEQYLENLLDSVGYPNPCPMLC